MKNPHKTRKVRCGHCSAQACQHFCSSCLCYTDISSPSVRLWVAEWHPYAQSNACSCPRSQTAHRRRAAGAGQLCMFKSVKSPGLTDAKQQMMMPQMFFFLSRRRVIFSLLWFQITFWQLQLDRHRLKMSKVAERWAMLLVSVFSYAIDLFIEPLTAQHH